MDVDGQSIFTDCKIKPETNDTKRPSSLWMEATSFYFYFLRAFYVQQKTAVLPFHAASSKDPSSIWKSLCFFG